MEEKDYQVSFIINYKGETISARVVIPTDLKVSSPYVLALVDENGVPEFFTNWSYIKSYLRFTN